MIELLSIDLSNYCSKQCSFCYNHSRKEGATLWKPEEVVAFASDCVKNGVKSVSLGGGEPFEYEGVFNVIDALFSLCYLSVTTNGLPLADEAVWARLMRHKPDKVHVTIHQPDCDYEVDRVLRLVKRLAPTGIKPGLNLLVGADKVDFARTVYTKFMEVLTPEQIILIPQRYGNTPTPKQIARVAAGRPFQSPSCLLQCSRPANFASVTWNKKVGSCSYSPSKVSLSSLDFNGLVTALKNVEWMGCNEQ